MSLKTAFVGIGNTLAGDDGAGIEAVKRLERKLSTKEKKNFLFYTITEDLFVVSEYIPFVKHFVFLDAFSGERIGEIVSLPESYENSIVRHSLSFHHTDISTVMRILKNLKIYEPFPTWEIWGITISPPSFLIPQLSKEIDNTVDRLLLLLVEKFIRK